MQTIFLADGEPDLTTEQVETKVVKSLGLKVIPAYAYEIIAGVLTKKSEIEADTSRYLRKGQRLGRVNRTSVAIIEVTIFEISQSDAVSTPAAVNEALILCEEFDDPEFKSFTNGILANFISGK